MNTAASDQYICNLQFIMQSYKHNLCNQGFICNMCPRLYNSNELPSISPSQRDFDFELPYSSVIIENLFLRLSNHNIYWTVFLNSFEDVDLTKFYGIYSFQWNKMQRMTYWGGNLLRQIAQSPQTQMLQVRDWKVNETMISVRGASNFFDKSWYLHKNCV